MPNKSVSRRNFMAAAGAVPAAAGAVRNPVVVPPVLLSDARSTGDPLKIVTRYRFEPHEVARIKAAAPKVAVEIIMCDTAEEFHEKVKDAEVVYGDIRGDALAYAKKLKWLQSGGAGMEGMYPALRSSPVVVTNYQRTFAPGITETGMGMLLCLTRGISKYYIPQF